MSSGRETLGAIERSIEDLRRREQTLQTALESANAKRANLVDARLRAFRELAEVRTRTAIADGIIDESDRLTDQVASLLEARTKTVNALTERQRAADATRTARTKAHDDLAHRIEGLEARLDAVAETVRSGMSSDPDYAQTVKTADEARAVLERAQAKTERARSDRAEKGRPYENDPLFMYLWRRKYGSSDYHPWNIIRWLDSKVAALIRYSEARANYAVLLAIPERLQEHTARLAEDAKAAAASVDAIEAQKIAAAAGEDLISELKTARASYTAGNTELARLAGEIAEISSQLNRYAEGLDHAFRKAVDMTADFLAEESLARLRNTARATATPSDDQIVERIATIDQNIDDLRDKVDDDRQQLEQIFAKKTELMRIAAEYRRSHYDDPASVFEPDGAGGIILEELLKGAIDAAEYWARTRRSHRWRSRPGDPFRRRSESWPMGDTDTNWGGGGDWGSGGGGNDEDFRTGGGF